HRWRAAVPASRLVHLSDCARLARRPGFLGASHGRDDPRSFTLRKSKEFSGSVPVHERAQYQHLEIVATSSAPRKGSRPPTSECFWISARMQRSSFIPLKSPSDYDL